MTDSRRASSTRLPFSIVDVFASTPLSGNPLAVFDNAQPLTTALMQRLASETNLSETAFVTGGSAADGFDVRIFTPSQELPFAGHPVLGTAAVLLGDANEVTLNLQDTRICVHRDARRLYFEAPAVTLGEALPAQDIGALTGLNLDDLDPQYWPCRADVGPRFTLVAVASLDALRRCQLHVDVHRRLFGENEMAEVYAYACESQEAGCAITTRLLFDAGGVREDPATGSAAVCLAHYLATIDKVPGDGEFVISQGGQIDRLSRLYLSPIHKNGGISVRLSGEVQAVASGAYSLTI